MPTRLIHFLSLITGFILCWPVLVQANGRDNYSLLGSVRKPKKYDFL